MPIATSAGDTLDVAMVRTSDGETVGMLVEEEGTGVEGIEEILLRSEVEGYLALSVKLSADFPEGEYRFIASRTSGVESEVIGSVLAVVGNPRVIGAHDNDIIYQEYNG